jgi:RNA polymerase sigma-70 factor (ECF subfamily)
MPAVHETAYPRLKEGVTPAELAEVSAPTWEAFRRFALDGRSAARVAEELGLTENTVLQAKSRILKRLRKEAGELLG